MIPMEHENEDKWIKEAETLQEELEQKLKKPMNKQEKQAFFRQYQQKLDTLLADMEEYDRKDDEEVRSLLQEMNDIADQFGQKSQKDNLL